MPELPEVETVVRALRDTVVGTCLDKMEYLRTNLRERIPIETLQNALQNREIKTVSRRGKYIVITSNHGYALLHLGMTGRVLYRDQAEPSEKHTHFIWRFSSPTFNKKNFWLHYVDPRRFGRLSGGTDSSWEEHPFLVGLGVEPLETPQLGETLHRCFGKRSAPVKNVLMDGRLVVGVGNIYACEALFRSRIHPQTPAGTLALNDCKLLARKVKEVLRQAIRAGGTTIKDFRSVDDGSGYFAVKLDVYGRTGETCNICHSQIKLVRLAGRSTWFCPNCQRIN